jgi:toxin ParE1/3/4
MRSVRVLEAAAAEAEAAAKWYEDQRAGLGGEFREAFKQALDVLHEGLVPGTPWPGHLGERGVKRIRIKRFPFHVVFVAPDAASEVLVAVAHQRRRPGYWRDRVPGAAAP